MRGAVYSSARNMGKKKANFIYIIESKRLSGEIQCKTSLRYNFCVRQCIIDIPVGIKIKHTNKIVCLEEISS